LRLTSLPKHTRIPNPRMLRRCLLYDYQVSTFDKLRGFG
jgi:hypothetical protein